MSQENRRTSFRTSYGVGRGGPRLSSPLSASIDDQTHRDPPQPSFIDRLPPELLSSILEICAESHSSPMKHYNCLARSMLVSRRWREVVVGTPGLWSCMPYPDCLNNLRHLILERSSSIGLEATVRELKLKIPNAAPLLVKVILADLHRFQSLELYLAPASVSHFSRCLPDTSTANLTSLTVHLIQGIAAGVPSLVRKLLNLTTLRLISEPFQWGMNTSLSDAAYQSIWIILEAIGAAPRLQTLTFSEEHTFAYIPSTTSVLIRYPNYLPRVKSLMLNTTTSASQIILNNLQLDVIHDFNLQLRRPGFSSGAGDRNSLDNLYSSLRLLMCQDLLSTWNATLRENCLSIQSTKQKAIHLDFVTRTVLLHEMERDGLRAILFLSTTATLWVEGFFKPSDPLWQVTQPFGLKVKAMAARVQPPVPELMKIEAFHEQTRAKFYSLDDNNQEQ